ncbi:MAG: PAS domain S-box protein [Rhodocyclaceae bacterium]
MPSTSLSLMLVDPDKDFQTLATKSFRAHGILVVCCDSGKQGLAFLRGRRCDLICVASDLPDGDGIGVCQRIRALPQYRSVPLAVCSDEFSEELRAGALLAGVCDVFLKSEVSQLVNVFARMAMQMLPIDARILYVEHSVTQAPAMLEQLARNGLKTDWFRTTEAALVAIEKTDYDLVLVGMRGINGAMLARRIRRMDSAWHEIPILALTTWDDTAQRIELFNIGIDDYMIRPIVEAELMARIRRMLERQKLIAELTTHRTFSSNLDSLARDEQFKQAEFAVRDSELAARLAMDNARSALEQLKLQKYALDQHAIVATTDAQGKITYANDKFCQISGYSRKELLGQDYALLNSGRHSRAFFNAMYETITRGGVWHGEICNRSKEGHLYWLDATIVPAMGGNGKPEQYITIRTDISERKRTDQALAAREEIYRSIVTQASDGIVLIDTETLRFVEFNDAARKGLGYSREEFAQLRVPDIQAEPDEAALLRSMSRIIATGRGSFDTLHRHKDGSLRNSHLSYRAITISERSCVVAIITDITERKASELELKRHREHLEELVEQQTKGLRNSASMAKSALDELRLQQFVLDQHAIVTICDVDGRITYGNDKFSQVSGYSREELIGNDHRLVNSGHHPKGFFKAMYESISQGNVWHAEVCNRAKAGHLYWVDTTIVAFMGEDGTPRQYIAVRTDISERKRIEEAAHAANRAKSEFLANMSHEIRTPMNGVVGMIDVLQQTPLTAEQARMVDTINDSSLALLHILNDILDYSKIEAGKLAIESISTCLRDVAEGVVQLMITTSIAKSIELSVFVSPELPRWILSDPTRLRQILLNLLGNALKFTGSRDGRRGRVILRVAPCILGDDGSGVQFRVIDNGIGVSEEALANLFRPFTQADESTARRYGGTGLGLSITQRLVEMMSGQISVRSIFGEGSEFTVEFPLQEGLPDRLLESEPSLAGLHVLAVTGDAECAQTLKAYCIAAGAQVTLVDALDGQRLAEAAPLAHVTVVLFGLDARADDESGLSGFLGVVRLVADGVGRCQGNRVTVSARPLLHRDLIHGVAFASGRLNVADIFVGSEKVPLLAKIKAPSVDEAFRAGRLILLAEDNETNREVIQEQLRILGYAAEMAEDGAVALKMWRSGRYALLLTDCHMPNMDGFELTAAIRQAEPKGTRLPIVALTANAMKGEAQRSLAQGMDDHLSKPLRLNEFDAMLGKWLPQPAAVESSVRSRVADQGVGRAVSGQRRGVGNGASSGVGGLPVLDEAPVLSRFPVWDPSVLTHLVGDDAATHRRLLDGFLLAAQGQVAAIGAAAAAGETVIVGDVAHKLKSSAHTVGASMLGELCQALETAGRSGDRPACRTLGGRLGQAFVAVAAQIGQAGAAGERP